MTIHNNPRVEGLGIYGTNAHADMAAYDQLPPELRAMLRESPVEFAAEPVLEAWLELAPHPAPHHVKIAHLRLQFIAGVESVREAIRHELEASMMKRAA